MGRPEGGDEGPRRHGDGQTLYWTGTAWLSATVPYTDGSTKVGVGTSSPQAALHVVSPVVGTTTVEIQAISGQTADLLDCYNATGATKLLSVTSAGAVSVASLTSSGNATILGTCAFGQAVSLKGLSLLVRAVTTTTSVNATDNVLTVSGTVTITLPTALGSGRQYTLKNMGTGTVTVVVAGGTQTIDGATSFAMSVQNQSRTFQADGSNYQIVGGYL